MWRDPWGYNNRIFEQIDKEFSDAEDMLIGISSKPKTSKIPD
jgi:hypothetical protein